MFGAPTKYKPEYCEAVRAHMVRGGSLGTFGPTIGVSPRTVRNWANEFPEFGEACEIAKGIRTAQVEYTLAEIVANGDKNKQLGACVYTLGNLAPDTWRNVQRTEITGAEGGPLQTVQRVERHVIDPKN